MAKFYSNIAMLAAAGAAVAMVDATNAGTYQRCLLGLFTSDAAKAANDTVVLARLPSNARILPGSTIIHDAMTGATDVDIGFDNDPDALLDGVSMAAAGIKSPLSGALNSSKKVWELAGLTEDPGGDLDLLLTFKTTMTAATAKYIAANIQYAVS